MLLQPGVRMLLSVRQLLNETDDDDDVGSVPLLTSLVLAVAESVQRMRRAAQRALAAYARDQGRGEEGRAAAAAAAAAAMTSELDVDDLQRAVVPYRPDGAGVSSTALCRTDDDYRLTLVALESCDAAYRQIQVRSHR